MPPAIANARSHFPAAANATPVNAIATRIAQSVAQSQSESGS
jgi:hypothetical protein